MASLQKSVNRIPVPASLEVSIRRRLRAQASRQNNQPLRWLAAAAAATLVIAASLTAVSGLRPAMSPELTRLMQIGFDEHVHCKHGKEYPFQPQSISKMTAILGPEFTAFLENVRHAEPELNLLQAHRCSYRGRVFTHVVLEENGSAVSVMLMPKGPGDFVRPEGASSSQFLPATQAGMTGAVLNGPVYVSYVVAEVSASKTLKLANMIQPALRQYTHRLSA